MQIIWPNVRQGVNELRLYIICKAKLTWIQWLYSLLNCQQIYFIDQVKIS